MEQKVDTKNKKIGPAEIIVSILGTIIWPGAGHLFSFRKESIIWILIWLLSRQLAAQLLPNVSLFWPHFLVVGAAMTDLVLRIVKYNRKIDNPA